MPNLGTSRNVKHLSLLKGMQILLHRHPQGKPRIASPEASKNVKHNRRGAITGMQTVPPLRVTMQTAILKIEALLGQPIHHRKTMATGSKYHHRLLRLKVKIVNGPTPVAWPPLDPPDLLQPQSRLLLQFRLRMNVWHSASRPPAVNREYPSSFFLKTNLSVLIRCRSEVTLQ